MTLAEAQKRILARMTADERAEFEVGERIVDWLMDIALDTRLPLGARDDARRKLRACAHRQPGQTVQDAVGLKH